MDRADPTGAEREGLAAAGGWAALAAAALLVVGLTGLLASSPGLGARNWLVVLFEINAGDAALPADPLRVFNALDIGILLLTAAALAGVSVTVAGARRIWGIVAALLPLAGTALLLVTHLAGRSSVMAAVIVAACVLIASRRRLLGGLGVVAGALLLVADFATSGSAAPVVAAAIAAGYVALIAWFLLLARDLLGRSRPAVKAAPSAGPEGGVEGHAATDRRELGTWRR